MKNIKAERLIGIIIFSSAAVWLASAWIGSVSFANVWAMIKLLPNVVTVDVLLFGIFAKWAWKWRWLQGWLVPFPNLNGSWTGTITPADDSEPNAITAMLVIKQYFLSVSCVMHTAEMTSHSYSADFQVDENAQLRRLVYTYNSRPKIAVVSRSPIHDGTTILDILGKPPKKLKGEYWNARKRVGAIELALRTRKQLDEIPRDLQDES